MNFYYCCRKSSRSREEPTLDACERCLEAMRAWRPPCFRTLARFLLLALSEAGLTVVDIEDVLDDRPGIVDEVDKFWFVEAAFG